MLLANVALAAQTPTTDCPTAKAQVSVSFQLHPLNRAFPLLIGAGHIKKSIFDVNQFPFLIQSLETINKK